jgi:putative FmdB family regulatory protein
MPIYEFYCSRCHRIFTFLSRSINVDKRPPCPKCGREELARRVSAFAISKGRKEDATGDDPLSGLDETRLERAMEALAGEAEGLDEEDPRQASRLMRKLFDATGLPLSGGMEEALRRMEAGEDMEKIEQDLGDVLDQDPFAAGLRQGGPGGLRRVLPPSVDTTLYEM